MRSSFTLLKGSKQGVALVLAMLCAGCTTTTTVTDIQESVAASGAAGRQENSQPALATSDYTVQRGDTLYAIAFRNRVDLRELIQWNGLAEPYTIYPGQRLRISNQERASEHDVELAADETAEAQTPPPRVARGRVPNEAGRIDAAPVAPSNDGPSKGGASASPARESPGQTAGTAAETGARTLVPATVAPPVSSLPAIPIAVDDGVREAVVDDTGATPALNDSQSPAVQPPLPPVASRTAPPPPALPQTPPEPQRNNLDTASAATRMAGGIGWRWPNSATLVGRYAADDEARQGIRLQAPAGTPVNASADGEVVYSGNGLVGLGELIIIKHGPEYLSAYGLNRKRLVNEGQKVKAGQAVAEMGNSAGVAGLLHFEVRRSGRPIDPLSVLPPR